MKFKVIGKENWKRSEYFDHYYSNVPCTYTMTVKLDITKIRESEQKLYPTLLHSITNIVNRHEEFRTSFNSNNQLGVFDYMFPHYTIFHKETETFSNVWTEYTEDYDVFYELYKRDMRAFGSVNKREAKPDLPANTFNIFAIPWITFEGFNFNLQKTQDCLLPIFTIGKYYEENDSLILPLAIQVHHALCDGFHLCRFVNELQYLINRL